MKSKIGSESGFDPPASAGQNPVTTQTRRVVVDIELSYDYITGHAVRSKSKGPLGYYRLFKLLYLNMYLGFF